MADRLKWMWLISLITVSAALGLELTFYSGVYGTCIGAMTQFGRDAKSLIGISGICIGIGEIVGELYVLDCIYTTCANIQSGTKWKKMPQGDVRRQILNFSYFLLSLPCLTRRGRLWNAEQKQSVWKEPGGAAGDHHSLCCIFSDFSQHCQ